MPLLGPAGGTPSLVGRAPSARGGAVAAGNTGGPSKGQINGGRWRKTQSLVLFQLE